MTSLEFATIKHTGQKRKDGREYITHPIAVEGIAIEIAKKIWKDELKSYPFVRFDFEEVFGGDHDGDLSIIYNRFLKTVSDVAHLHDTYEDTETTYDELEYGFGTVAADSVIYLSKLPNENYFDFTNRVMDNFIASIVKLADLTHNMSDLNEGSMKDKYRFAYDKIATKIGYV